MSWHFRQRFAHARTDSPWHTYSYWRRRNATALKLNETILVRIRKTHTPITPPLIPNFAQCKILTKDKLLQDKFTLHQVNEMNESPKPLLQEVIKLRLIESIETWQKKSPPQHTLILHHLVPHQRPWPWRGRQQQHRRLSHRCNLFFVLPLTKSMAVATTLHHCQYHQHRSMCWNRCIILV